MFYLQHNVKGPSSDKSFFMDGVSPGLESSGPSQEILDDWALEPGVFSPAVHTKPPHTARCAKEGMQGQ